MHDARAVHLHTQQDNEVLANREIIYQNTGQNYWLEVKQSDGLDAIFVINERRQAC